VCVCVCVCVFVCVCVCVREREREREWMYVSNQIGLSSKQTFSNKSLGTLKNTTSNKNHVLYEERIMFFMEKEPYSL